jgi:hypothetical protein
MSPTVATMRMRFIDDPRNDSRAEPGCLPWLADDGGVLGRRR